MALLAITAIAAGLLSTFVLSSSAESMPGTLVVVLLTGYFHSEMKESMFNLVINGNVVRETNRISSSSRMPQWYQKISYECNYDSDIVINRYSYENENVIRGKLIAKDEFKIKDRAAIDALIPAKKHSAYTELFHDTFSYYIFFFTEDVNIYSCENNEDYRDYAMGVWFVGVTQNCSLPLMNSDKEKLFDTTFYRFIRNFGKLEIGEDELDNHKIGTMKNIQSQNDRLLIKYSPKDVTASTSGIFSWKIRSPDCGPSPEPPLGVKMKCTSPKRTICRYSCKSDPDLLQLITCEPYDIWSEVKEKLNCPCESKPVEVDLTVRNCSQNQKEKGIIGDTCDYQCRDGYIGKPVTVSCGEDGWALPDIQCKHRCELKPDEVDLTVRNCSLNRKKKGIIGDTCDYQCRDGYIGEPVTVSCGENGWVLPDIQCKLQASFPSSSSSSKTQILVVAGSTEEKDLPIAAIAGGISLLVVAILVIIGLVILLRRRRKKDYHGGSSESIITPYFNNRATRHNALVDDKNCLRMQDNVMKDITTQHYEDTSDHVYESTKSKIECTTYADIITGSSYFKNEEDHYAAVENLSHSNVDRHNSTESSSLYNALRAPNNNETINIHYMEANFDD